MKKFIATLILVTAFSPLSWADAKPTLIYDKKTGDVLAVGYFTPGDTTPTQGVEYLNADIPKESIIFYKRTSKGKIELKSKAEIDAIKQKDTTLDAQKFQDKYNSLPDDKTKEQFLLKAVAKLANNLKEDDFK